MSSRRADLHHRELRADHVGHARAQPPALWPLVGAAADRVPAALQQRLPGRHDELRVRHRAVAVGAGGVDLAARAQHRAATCASRRCSCWRCSSATCSRSGSMASVCWRSSCTGCGSLFASAPRPLLADFAAGVGCCADPRFLRRRPAFLPGGAAADDESDLEAARQLRLGILRQARWPDLSSSRSTRTSRLSCSPASSPSPPAGARGTARSVPSRSAGCCWRSAASSICAMPRIIFETYMADQRLPISLAFMMIACAHLNLRHRSCAHAALRPSWCCCWRCGCSRCRRCGPICRATASFREFGPPHRPRHQGHGRLCRSGRRRRRARPRRSFMPPASPSSSARRW